MLLSRKDTGFTLVEVMVSLVIFLVASMGLLPLLLTSMQANHDAGLHARARQLAGKVMAELQVIDYGSLDAFSGLQLSVDNFQVRQQIDRESPLDGQSKITVTTSWQHKGRSHRYQLQTIRTAP